MFSGVTRNRFCIYLLHWRSFQNVVPRVDLASWCWSCLGVRLMGLTLLLGELRDSGMGWDILFNGRNPTNQLEEILFTPPKTNVEPKNWWFADVSPFQGCLFRFYVSFRGVSHYLQGFRHTRWLALGFLPSTVALNGDNQFPYYPWDERYIYLNEWLICMVN